MSRCPVLPVPARLLGLAGLATALTIAVAGPVGATPVTLAVGPALAQRTAPGCASAPAPARPVTEAPWPHLRYAPDRLAPLATGAGVTVAVIDSGVDRRHPQLAGRVLDGSDFLDRPGDGTRDCAGHGTGVASIIAAAPRPGIAFRGLAPEARILPVRVSEQQVVDGQESGRTVEAAEFARAIRWAVDRGAQVLNLSVVLYADDPAVREAVAHAVDRDVVVVAAAGNLHGSGDPVPYPAAYEGVLGVGALTPAGSRADFSQTGPHVDLVAPGSDVLLAVPGQGHRSADGTSYATPFVAATAALVRQYRPDLTGAEVARRIVATVDPAPGGSADGYGAGVLNPYRAIVETALSPHPSGSPAAGLPDDLADPEVVVRQARRARAEKRATLVASGAAAVVTVAVLTALVLPRGVRRRWRPAGSA
ncbi:type VII secretion-associated serine protease mycosin [Micromonospora sp. NPDC000207]|uniref:type VII secretion-associated serine protease mycosin n=1 Tax=Micromonospora sp. NPDC000207 TaxID=3154246 RepID=UPI00332EA9C6